MMVRKHAFSLLVALTFMIPAAGSGVAAEMRHERDDLYNCTLTISGVIEKGDAEKLSGMLASPRMQDGVQTDKGEFARICLDSPGGSFAEALRMARLVYSRFGTAVENGARCESACAMLFMAGSISPEDDRGVIADRLMHPTARLGFHSPSLLVPQGDYDESAVNKAYAVAVAGIGELIGMSGYLKFPPTLIEAMLAVPPEEMRHIETVGEAARWQISVAPTVEPRELTPIGIVNACNNWDQFKTDVITINGFFGTRKDLIQAMELPKIEREEGIERGTLPGFEQEAASDCVVTIEQAGRDRPGPTGWIGIGGEVGVEMFPYMLFSRDTAIEALARTDDTRAERVALQERSAPWVRRGRGECFVFDGDSMIDHDPCEVEVSTSSREDFSATEITSYIWPSGARTVHVSTSPLNGGEGAQTINGASTTTEFGYSLKALSRKVCEAASFPASNSCDFSCWPNSQTGKRFCFFDHSVHDRPLTRWEPEMRR